VNWDFQQGIRAEFKKAIYTGKTRDLTEHKKHYRTLGIG